MLCRHAREIMSARLDYDIDPVGAEQLEDHLDGCPNCRQVWQAMCRADTVIRRDPPVIAPFDFVDFVMQRIALLDARCLQPPAWRRWVFLAIALSLLVTAVAVPTATVLALSQFDPTSLTGTWAWLGDFGHSFKYWGSVIMDDFLGAGESVLGSLFGELGVVVLAGGLVLLGLLLASYTAVVLGYQRAVSRA